MSLGKRRGKGKRRKEDRRKNGEKAKKTMNGKGRCRGYVITNQQRCKREDPGKRRSSYLYKLVEEEKWRGRAGQSNKLGETQIKEKKNSSRPFVPGKRKGERNRKLERPSKKSFSCRNSVYCGLRLERKASTRGLKEKKNNRDQAPAHRKFAIKGPEETYP